MPRPCLAAAVVTALASAAGAQPVEIPLAARVGAAPERPGIGARAMAVHAFFQGFPSDLRDARDLLEGRSLAPAFDVWCGLVPYVDFTNGAVRDSLGNEAPTVLCLPFLDPDRGMSMHSCRALRTLPRGRYHMGGGLVMRVQGALALRRAGVRTFAWGHDDGVAFALGGVTVFEFNDPTGPRVDRRAVSVPAPGLYPFTLEWYDTAGGALVDWYAADGDATEGSFGAERFALVPAADLYPDERLGCTPDCRPCAGATPVCDHGAGRCVACDDDARCPACQVCSAGSCVPAEAVVDASPARRCAPDADVVDAGSGMDAGADASSPRAVPPGCACRATPSRRGARGMMTALALLVYRRRRRS